MVAGSLIVVPASTTIAYVDDPANRELVTSTECIVMTLTVTTPTTRLASPPRANHMASNTVD